MIDGGLKEALPDKSKAQLCSFTTRIHTHTHGERAHVTTVIISTKLNRIDFTRSFIQKAIYTRCHLIQGDENRPKYFKGFSSKTKKKTSQPLLDMLLFLTTTTSMIRAQQKNYTAAVAALLT